MRPPWGADAEFEPQELLTMARVPPAPAPVPSEIVDASVADVVVRVPKTLPVGTSVGAARAALRDDHVHLLLLTEQGRLRGTLARGDVPDHADDSSLALPYAVVEGRTVGGDLSAEQALALMTGRGQRRLVVIDDEGALLGLLCLKRKPTGFCSDADVRERASDPRPTPGEGRSRAGRPPPRSAP